MPATRSVTKVSHSTRPTTASAPAVPCNICCSQGLLCLPLGPGSVELEYYCCKAHRPPLPNPSHSQSRALSHSVSTNPAAIVANRGSDKHELISGKCEAFMNTLAAVLVHQFPHEPDTPACSCSQTVEPGRRAKKGCPECIAYTMVINVYTRIYGRPANGLQDAFKDPRIIIRCPRKSRLLDVTLCVVDQLRLTDLEVVCYEST
ncbi:hypothetical protein DENSPDRAFT_839491 [Dentipellis sp. KUC8613]|nr:hypothetical protein DENSPDRAFT_839491 [Dentipellis sp. KUC8613]